MPSNNQQVFLELVRAGLWEKEARLSQYDSIDFHDVYRLAEEQSVIGLVTAGFEHIIDKKIPQDIALSCVGYALQLEKRNIAMNVFVAKLIEKLRKADVYAILVKGQGIAQCYEKPLWRSAGDVDLLLSDSNFVKAKAFLSPLSTEIMSYELYTKHLGMTIDSWFVEIHGTLRTGLSGRVDRVIDEVQRDVFYGGNVRSWENGGTTVFLPSPDNDVIFVFTHILQHFFEGGIGLRQLCDLARLLWTYRETINRNQLKKRVKSMGLFSEWKAFGYVLVNSLGLPKDSMPFFDDSYSTKAERIISFIMETGNFGHNRDLSYQKRYSPFFRKILTAWYQTKDTIRLSMVFPKDAPAFLMKFFFEGVKAAIFQRVRSVTLI